MLKIPINKDTFNKSSFYQHQNVMLLMNKYTLLCK